RPAVERPGRSGEQIPARSTSAICAFRSSEPSFFGDPRSTPSWNRSPTFHLILETYLRPKKPPESHRAMAVPPRWCAKIPQLAEPPVELSPARRTLGCSFLLGPAVKRTTRCDQARSSAARRRKSVPGRARSRVSHRDAGTCRRRAGDRFGSSAHAVPGTAVARVTFGLCAVRICLGSRRGRGSLAGGTHMGPTKHRARIEKVRTQQRRRRVRRVLHLSILGAIVGRLPPARALPPDAAAVTYGRIATSFEANRGQTDPRVEFLTRGKGVSVFFTPAEVVLALRPRHPGELLGGAALFLRFAGANPRPPLVGEDELPGKSNYFIGNDPARWHTDVPTYARLRYGEVYP